MSKKSSGQLFYKLFYRYTLLLACIVVALVCYFISSTRARVLETNLNYMKMMTEKAVEYMNKCEKTTGYIQAGLYQSTPVLEDLLWYFNSEAEEYQRYRLDTFMASQALSYEGFDDFAENAMKSNPEIISMEFIAYGKSQVTACYPDGRLYVHQGAKERMEEAESGNLAQYGQFSFIKEIRDPDTLMGIGCMIVNYRTTELQTIYTYYDKAQLLVYTHKNTLVFLSDKELDAERLFEAETQNGGAERYLKAYVQKADVENYTVFAYINKSQAARIPVSVFLTIVGIGLAVIILGTALVHAHLLRLTGRLNTIIDGMNQVMTGDLSIRLPSEADGDELDVISSHFNEMCQELYRYIQKSYLAEIEQKNAELEALQNQINPHFLYNTLEAIRMKAICNGDREVGRMLYSMAVIFRSQVKDDDIIPLIQEIHYCKKYVELFEYRYQEKFISRVECPEELMDYPVMKFILQPVIENYFVHGIRGEQEGNRLHIWAEKEDGALAIHVEDNGRGMDPEEMERTNEQLKGNGGENKKSIGITNVNRRIRAVYGEDFGVTLKKSRLGGIHVVIKVGISEEIQEKVDAE